MASLGKKDSNWRPPVVILAGGYGTRIKEYPEPIAKPMVPVGGMPILWHIMKTYSRYGFKRFIVCLGYRGDTVRNFFSNYAVYHHDVTLTLGGSTRTVEVHTRHDEPVDESWKVSLVDTGLHTMTGGRIRRAAPWIEEDHFVITYGDGLCDSNFLQQLEFHLAHNAEVTLTGVRQYSRFGHIGVGSNNQVQQFIEKPLLSEVVSGGFMICSKKFLDRIEGDSTVLESGPLMEATKDGGVYCYQHQGFWACMDTYRDYEYLNGLYDKREAPWVSWGYGR